MRVKNGRSSGATRRSTRRADSSRSVPCARVMLKTPSCRLFFPDRGVWFAGAAKRSLARRRFEPRFNPADNQLPKEGTMATTLATWTIDPVHSSVEFSLDYMGFSTYRTGFRALEGSLAFDAARPDASSVNASIPAASVDVTNDRLMGRLMDADLLGGTD